MKIPASRLALSALLLTSLLVSARAEETLWSLDFKNLKPGEAPTAAPFSAPSSSPQRVMTDAENTLVGAKAVGPLTSPLLFDKESTSHYLPALFLKGTTPITSGVITVNFDLVFDHINASAEHPVEALMAFPFINGDGGSTFILVVASQGGSSLVLGGAGLKRGKTPVSFKPGEVGHIKAVLDLNAHSFQAFLNDVPMADAEVDEKKFVSFLGLTVRDGTALGGNQGATFSAGIGNLVITKS